MSSQLVVFHRVYVLYKISYMFSAYIYVFQMITANTLLVTARSVIHLLLSSSVYVLPNHIQFFYYTKQTLFITLGHRQYSLFIASFVLLKHIQIFMTVEQDRSYMQLCFMYATVCNFM
jgi:hypothetical protein